MAPPKPGAPGESATEIETERELTKTHKINSQTIPQNRLRLSVWNFQTRESIYLLPEKFYGTRILFCRLFLFMVFGRI